MKSLQLTRFAAAALAAVGLLSGALTASPAAALGPDAVRPGFDSSELARNDDGSTSLVDIGFPVDFFGTTYDFVYVNNNGNVTFDAPMGTYTPFDLNSTDRVIIAPFFADVDTRTAGEPVRYGPGLVEGREAFGVSWSDVDCYSSSSTRSVRNHFQLVMIDRSDLGAGDFDMELNFDQIQWETGQASGGSFDCLGGSSARVGYANGQGTSFELPGSGVPGALLDSNLGSGLIHNRLGTDHSGRYVFEVRNGTPPGASISGVISAAGVPVAGALVQGCADGFCRADQADGNGEYTVRGLFPGDYQMRALPPAGSNLNPATVGPVSVAAGEDVVGIDIVLTGPTPQAAGTSIQPSDTGSSGLPSVSWHDALTLTTRGCQGGAAAYEIVSESGTLIESGTMDEGPAGTYSVVVGPFFPVTGSAHVTISIACPGTGVETTEFDLYIDPSGVVRTTFGIPIAGATVTLLRADEALATFSAVPDGSAIMSPSNRANPDATDSRGRFGWDVIAGFYIVRAEADGCAAPSDPGVSYVETTVLEIPPPVTDLVLELDCGGPGSAIGLTQAARDLVAGVLPTGDDKSDKRLVKAVGRLDLALEPVRWIDGDTLDRRLGKRVLGDQRKAAKIVAKVDDRIALGTDELQTALDLLIDADARIAFMAIDEARAGGGDPDRLAAAEREVTKAEVARAEGDAPKAMRRYAKAWRHAMGAL